MEPQQVTNGRRSVYEQRARHTRLDEDVVWTPVAEIHPDGRLEVQEGWANRARGWTPLGDWLSE